MLLIKAANLFYEFLRLRNLSAGTITQYHWTLDRFIANFGTLKVSDISLDIFHKYQGYLRSKNYKPRVYQHLCTNLKVFLRYLKDEELTTINVQRLMIPRASEEQQTYLTQEELMEVLEYYKRQPDSIDHVRNFALYSSLYTTGLSDP